MDRMKVSVDVYGTNHGSGYGKIMIDVVTTPGSYSAYIYAKEGKLKKHIISVSKDEVTYDSFLAFIEGLLDNNDIIFDYLKSL